MSDWTTERRVNQEPEGVDTRRMAMLGLAVVVVTAGCLLLVWWVMPADMLGSPVAEQKPDLPISSVEQGDIGRTARGLREREQARARLDAFGWADREGSIAIIPIDEAMKLYVEGHRPGATRVAPRDEDGGGAGVTATSAAERDGGAPPTRAPTTEGGGQ